MAGRVALTDHDGPGPEGHMFGHGVEPAQITLINTAADAEGARAAGVAGIAAASLGTVGWKGLEFQHGSVLVALINLGVIRGNGKPTL